MVLCGGLFNSGEEDEDRNGGRITNANYCEIGARSSEWECGYNLGHYWRVCALKAGGDLTLRDKEELNI